MGEIQETTRNNKMNSFGARGWFIVIFFGVMLFFYASLTADGMNVIVPALSGANGWDSNLMLSVNGIGGYIAVAAIIVMSALVTKFGAKKVILVTLGITAVAFLVMGFTKSFSVFTAMIILIQVCTSGMGFGGCSALVASWFPRKKGVVMGWSTMGCNLATAVFVPIYALLNAKGNVHTPFVFYFAVMVLMLILGGVFIKNTPEMVGLAPDNDNLNAEQIRAQEQEYKNHKSEWSYRRLLKDKEVWLMGIGYGLLFLTTAGLVIQFVPRIMTFGYEQGAAITMFSIAAVIGIVASYFWGVIDYKYSTKLASKILALWFVATIIFNFLPGKGCLYVSIFMLGAGLGGNANFATSMCAGIFGKYDFPRAWNIVFPVFAAFKATASVILGVTLALSGNSYTVAYIVFLISALVAFVLFFFINSTLKGRA